MLALVSLDQRVEIRVRARAPTLPESASSPDGRVRRHCTATRRSAVPGRTRPAFATIAPMKLVIDHIVVAAPDLDSGARHVARLLGVEPARAASRMGTHNRVLGMAGGMYLEVIAIDPDAAAPERPRWFGLDEPAMRERLRGGPFLAHWAASRCRTT